MNWCSFGNLDMKEKKNRNAEYTRFLHVKYTLKLYLLIVIITIGLFLGQFS